MGNSSTYLFFSAADGNLLIRILIPLILGLVIGNRVFVRWEGKIVHPLLQGGLASLLTLGFTLNPTVAGTLSISYILVPLTFHFAAQQWPSKKKIFGLLEKALMALAALLVWSIFVPGVSGLWAAMVAMILDYNASLIVLGYICMLWPTSYIVKFCLLGIDRSTSPSPTPSPTEPDAERGGRMIGMFERAIIFTLVLLGEFSAIGFLITGKSIIRFAQSNEKLRSEYVLVGTMVSYAVAILAGVLVKWLLKIG
jgi:hypothetical protein